MKNFKDKVAVVTGAASGIGRGMAESFVAAGMKVVLSDIEKQALIKTTESLRAAGADVHAVVTDVSQSSQVEALAKATLERFGKVHLLCNNAGIAAGGQSTWTSTLDDWNWIVGVNLMGVVHGIRTFLPIMISQDEEAHIVNTASMAGLIVNAMPLYAATKSAVVALSEGVYLELQRDGLKPGISVLCPGFVNTGILNSRRNRPKDLAHASQESAGPAAEAFRNWFVEQLKNGLPPRAVGEQVLAAIRAEHFYILTHPEMLPLVQKRTADIIAGGNPAGMPITAPPVPAAESARS
ncbi:MAG TPA: SDR family NAD(P)-dependent oxidoreductase [Steroidobacteraceae bacterium]|jgi:NADP-dependent 3-hydroxy acid dehydrogenase YdfG